MKQLSVNASKWFGVYFFKKPTICIGCFSLLEKGPFVWVLITDVGQGKQISSFWGEIYVD